MASNRSSNRLQGDGDSQGDARTRMTLLMIQVVALCLAIPHLIIAAASVLIGLTLLSKAPVVLANTIAPIWSGGIYFVTGLFGLFAAKRKTSYTMCCFAGFSVVSLMVGTISIQLLRMGIVDNTTDGQVFLKQKQQEKRLMQKARLARSYQKI